MLIEDFAPASPTCSIREKRFKNINVMLKTLAKPECGQISVKQYHLFMQLYTHEDMIMLSAWEVFFFV